MTQQLSWNNIKNEPSSSILQDANGNQITVGQLKEIVSEAARKNQGREMSMIDIQSLISKRATALQLTTNMLQSINEATKNTAANIGR